MVAIITLSYNQNEYTLRCIESILRTDNVDFKLILVDNGSAPENYLDLQNNLPDCDKIHLKRIEKNRGYVGGINYGLEEGMKSNPDHFLILNNDTILDKNAVSELIITCNAFGNKAIVSGKVYHYDEPNRLQYIGSSFKNKQQLGFIKIGLNELDNGQYDEAGERDMLDDIFWLFPAKLYREIGGYSTFFWFNYEQLDFALRAKKIGYKMVYNPKALLWHKGSVSIGGREKNPKQAYWTIQGKLILNHLHLSGFSFIHSFVKTSLSIIGTSVKSVLYGFTGDKSLSNYAKAKRQGLYYYLRWCVYKNKNKGQGPFS